MVIATVECHKIQICKVARQQQWASFLHLANSSQQPKSLMQNTFYVIDYFYMELQAQIPYKRIF
jgi:hypothetical protein